MVRRALTHRKRKGKRYQYTGLAGDNEMDQARADMAYGCADDLYSIMMPMFMEKDMEKRVR